VREDSIVSNEASFSYSMYVQATPEQVVLDADPPYRLSYTWSLKTLLETGSPLPST